MRRDSKRRKRGRRILGEIERRVGDKKCKKIGDWKG